MVHGRASSVTKCYESAAREAHDRSLRRIRAGLRVEYGLSSVMRIPSRRRGDEHQRFSHKLLLL